MKNVAHAIFTVNGNYVLQLRDENPNISEPGMWSLFGGEIEPLESAEEAIIRETQEELCITLQDYQPLCNFEYFDMVTKQNIYFHIFESDISGLWDKCRLLEGQAVKYYCFDELEELKVPNIIMKILCYHYRRNNTTFNLGEFVP